MSLSVYRDESAVWHHSMNRGASRRDVFPILADHEDFARLAAEIHPRFGVEVHAYCLMGNHYHLLVRAPLVDPRPALRFLDDGYREGFHGRHLGGAPLLGQRYHVVPIATGRHLAYVSRYIHLNPIEAALALRPEDWPFSSYRAYLDPTWAPPWLSTQTIIGWFGLVGGRRRYRLFVEQGLDPGSRDFYGKRRLRPVLGEDFQEELDRRRALESIVSLDAIRGPGPALGERDRPPLPLAVIARAVAHEFNMLVEHLDPRSRVDCTRGQLARGAVVHAARRLCGYRLREIATWIGYTSPAAAVAAATAFADRARRDAAVELRLVRALECLRSRARP